jgi:SAM-dependent methyltransferase
MKWGKSRFLLAYEISGLKFSRLFEPILDIHPSVLEQALQHDAIESLQDNRIDPKFLYVTPRQAELWRQVFLKHSPIHANPEFARIYKKAFAGVANRFKNQKIMLVGLGCGTGLKELELCTTLRAKGCEALFSAIDVSRNLVLESAKKLMESGAGHRRSLVCDLTQSAFLKNWLDGGDSRLPRVITFFGLAPNFTPQAVTRLFRTVLRPGDLLLASAHLAPARVENAGEIRAAMDSILPQYDNPETLAWLTAALEVWDLEHFIEPPKMEIGELEKIPAFLIFAPWKSATPFEKWGHRFSPKIAEPLRLFFSLRYTPALFETLLHRDGLSFELLSITSCHQEAIWCIRKNDSD